MIETIPRKKELFSFILALKLDLPFSLRGERIQTFFSLDLLLLLLPFPINLIMPTIDQKKRKGKRGEQKEKCCDEGGGEGAPPPPPY